jgi:mannose-6-phosphate isomerase-like protein (cupin superfamily)
MTVSFLKTHHETGGVFDAYEVTIPPGLGLTVPHLTHLHRQCDETVIGIDGYTMWSVGGVSTRLRPGEQLFIPRGATHRLINEESGSARVLCVLTPGVLGPEYFHELACAMDCEGPTDYAALCSIMARYGVIPSTI